MNPKRERVLIQRLEYYTCLLYRLMQLTGAETHQEAMRRVEEAIAYQKSAGAAESFTGRQREIIRLTQEGLTAVEMAGRLHVSKRTIDYHIANIYAKLGCSNRVQMLKEAAERGLL